MITIIMYTTTVGCLGNSIANVELVGVVSEQC